MLLEPTDPAVLRRYGVAAARDAPTAALHVTHGGPEAKHALGEELSEAALRRFLRAHLGGGEEERAEAEESSHSPSPPWPPSLPPPPPPPPPSLPSPSWEAAAADDDGATAGGDPSAVGGEASAGDSDVPTLLRLPDTPAVKGGGKV